MRLKFAAITTLVAALFVSSRAFGLPIYTIEQAVAVAQAHNPEIAIARDESTRRAWWLGGSTLGIPSVGELWQGWSINDSSRRKLASAMKITMRL